jgi:DNA-binding NarL/FixJ family response regulator
MIRVLVVDDHAIVRSGIVRLLDAESDIEVISQTGLGHEAVLSNRELQVLIRLARGMTTKEVADALNLSNSTVETYRSRVLEKLNLRNNSDMTRFAIRRALIDLD